MAQPNLSGKHSILLVNFARHEAEVLEKAGFNVELGFIGALKDAPKVPVVQYCLPRPLYEYEVLVYNSTHNRKEVLDCFASDIKSAALDDKMFEPLVTWKTLPAIRIAFIGVSSGAERLIFAGLPSLALSEAHEGVSVFVIARGPSTFAIPMLGKVIESLRKDISTPVGQYCFWAEEHKYPFTHIPVIVNRNGDQIASYGTFYRDRSMPAYVVLPQLQNNAIALKRVLEVIAQLRPELFPDRETRDWYESDEFAFREENRIDQEIEARIKETVGFVEAKRAEKTKVVAQYAFIKKILIAREDPGLAGAEKLSTNVRSVLEFIGFAVEDIDATIRGVIKKEDFWVKEGSEFLAITEITGTNAKNPKTKEYNDLLGRMTTVFKRRDLVPDASKISGLLVVNYDIDTHPWKRPKLYAGDAEEIVAAAIEQNIGLLSTVELYRIAIAVKDGTMTKEQARSLIKGLGRIEYRPVARNTRGEEPQR